MKTKVHSTTLATAATVVAFSMLALSASAATFIWTNTLGGSWGYALNWSPNSVPGPNDTALITNTFGTIYTVTLDGGGTVSNLTLGGPNLGGLVSLSQHGQQLTINGTLTVNNNTDYGINSGVLYGNGNALLRGAIHWTAGYLAGAWTVDSGSTLVLDGSSIGSSMPGCALTNNGTVVWKAGHVEGGLGGTLIHNNGLWDCQCDQTVMGKAWGGPNGIVFINAGVCRKSASQSAGGATLFDANAVFYNTGQLDAQTNFISFLGGGSFSGGTVTNLAGWVELVGGAFNINGTVTSANVLLNGASLAGNNVINGGLSWMYGDWNNSASETIASNAVLLITAGSVNHHMANCTVTNNGTVVWQSGYIDGGGVPGTVIYNNGLWDCQCDQLLTGTYGGNGTIFNNTGICRKSASQSPGGITLFDAGVVFNNSGQLDSQTNYISLKGGGTFSGGRATNLAGWVELAGGAFNINGTITSTNVLLNGATLTGNNVINAGLNWVYGDWNNSASEIIASDAVLLISAGQGDHHMLNCTVTNNGTVVWTGGYIDGGGVPGTVIYNNGLWDCRCDQSLTAYYAGNGIIFDNTGVCRKSASQSPGGITLFDAGVVFHNAGQLNSQTNYLALKGGGSFSGGSATNSAGWVDLVGGQFNINGTVTSTNVLLDGASLVGNNVFRGGLNWIFGDWNDSASETIASNAVLLITAGLDHHMANCIVTNNGTVVWHAGWIDGGDVPGTVIYNNGLWDCQCDYSLNAVYGGNGTIFNNAGTFRKELSTGTTAITNGVTFNNTGTLDAQDGKISLLGSTFSLAKGTKMSFGLGGPAGNGSISLPGAASFTGSVKVNLNGFFWPAVGSTFNLLSYTSRVGTLFTNTALPAPGFLTWTTNYGSTNYSISLLAHTSTNTSPTNVFLTVLNVSNVLIAWPGDHTGWRLQAQTNSISVGLSTNWATVAGSSLTNQVLMPIDKTLDTVFYRMIYP